MIACVWEICKPNGDLNGIKAFWTFELWIALFVVQQTMYKFIFKITTIDNYSQYNVFDKINMGKI